MKIKGLKIRKLGKKRPLLYKGKFGVPRDVIQRLRIAKNHLILAQIAHFNGKINQYYMTIDNLLAAVIITKEGDLTTQSHHEKIKKFFKHLGRRAKIRRIERTDFKEFYDLWAESRYSFYFPKSKVVERIRLFTFHLFDFVITEIARIYKSDETILSETVNEGIKVYQSDAILEKASDLHDYHEMEAEQIGDRYGSKLGMKLANPWNFMDIALVSDREDIIELIDNSKEIENILYKLLIEWDDLVFKTWELNYKKICLKMAKAKMAKRRISLETALNECFESAAKHPDAHGFRLVLDFSYDPFDPKRAGKFWIKMINNIRDLDANPNKTIKNGWEKLKD